MKEGEDDLEVMGLSICGERGYGRKLLLASASSLSQSRWSVSEYMQHEKCV